MSKALYRKYRSKRLSEIVGQKHVTDILTRSLAEGRIAHAYLLTGPRGVGKTSIARILAHEINHLPYDDDSTHLDIIEIDAASNNGVEDIRSLREKVQVAPVAAAKKVYIIDEVHMLSKAAFNALLKTLEEPPEHAVFILATTDIDKIPATIISRTQRFSLRASHPKDAAEHLAFIAKQENITIDSEALELIALRGDGSFRDSISLLDQLRGIADSKSGITRQLVEDSLGLAPHELVSQLLNAYEAKDLKSIVNLLDESEQSGVQASVLASQLIQAVRASIAKNPQFLVLLDELLTVTKSSQPNIKLLTVLAARAVVTSKPKTVALASPAPVISAPIAELVRQATKPKPSIPTPRVAEPTPPQPTATNLKPGTELDWTQLVEYTRTNFVAVYSVLCKCTHEIEGNVLTIYTGNPFYKKKLDDTKHRVNLIAALTVAGPGEWIIETIGTQRPPKDSQAAAVAAIMGGGEEVSVD
jgi:DNA polymerase-3 subunit gamma/tau